METIVIKLIMSDALYADPDYKPEPEKPAGECFWCGGKFNGDHYYARCKNCREAGGVVFAECGPVQARVNQPAYFGEYPTGSYIFTSKEFAAEFVNSVTNGGVKLDDGVGEVLLYPDPYQLLYEETEGLPPE